MEEGGEEVECRVGGYVERLGVGVHWRQGQDPDSLWNVRLFSKATHTGPSRSAQISKLR